MSISMHPATDAANREWRRRLVQDGGAGGKYPQGDRAAVGAAAHRCHKAALDQAFDQIAGSRLVNIERPGQPVHADVRGGLDHAQGPKLGAADTGVALDLPKVRFHRIENDPKLA